jgi:hypothetical protein
MALRRLVPIVLSAAVALALPAHAAARPQAEAAAVDANDLVAELGDLDALMAGKATLTTLERTLVHDSKAKLIASVYTQQAAGVQLADVITGLDCVDTDIQRARNSNKKSTQKSWVGKARMCQKTFVARLKAAGASASAVLPDASTLGKRIADVATAVRKGKAFGAKATAIRAFAADLVGNHFDASIGGVPFSEHFRDLECVDVKVEAGRISGASSCAERLARLLKEQIKANPPPPPPPITWGSDLTGDPVSIDGTWREDSEFWNSGIFAPADGLITEFRLKVGDQPTAIPIRFSIVRPQPDGTVKVILTTDPPFMLPAHAPDVYTVNSNSLSFRCCKIVKGDIISVDNRGANTVQDPYHWFAQKRDKTTFSHMVAGVSQDAGQIWTATPNPGYEVLLQITEQPSGP